ncbi:hypothetical protein [Mycolicibacterium sphagni]|uniref:Uncharacterized protein n=1 Tax=Mycolicibacterium sphagni TaxID=1786 RepID=A0A255D785_9MYCO|nr:hypothetical protein [Mycolicibacterium sphagni]OYN74920.1 hypothetical protein CG716_26850 [Mycolicibacterium sphagni]
MTIGVDVVLVLVLLLTVFGPDPATTIGVGASEVSVEPDFEGDPVVCDVAPSGITIGFGLDFSSSLPPPNGDSNCGGQSTEVGGQL